MGFNMLIYIKRKQLKNLVDDFDNFMFLVNKTYMRWYIFQWEFGTEKDKITCKELLVLLANTDKKIKDRKTWANLCQTYDLIFQSEKVEEEPEDYVEVWDFFLKLKEFVKKNIKQIQLLRVA